MRRSEVHFRNIRNLFQAKGRCCDAQPKQVANDQRDDKYPDKNQKLEARMHAMSVGF